MILTPGQNKKKQQKEPNGLRFDRWTQHLLRHTSQSTPLGKQNACYGRCFWNSFVLWFLHLWVHLCIWQVRWIVLEKPLKNTWFFGRFVGETHKAGNHHWVFSKDLVGSICRWVFMGWLPGCFFLDRHHPWGVSIILLASLGTYLVLSPYKVLLWNRSESILLTLALVSLAAFGSNGFAGWLGRKADRVTESRYLLVGFWRV